MRTSIHLAACSISRSMWEWLKQGKLSSVRVLAVFESACDLVTADGDVIALVSSEVGNGPLNVVVEVAPSPFTGLELGMPATLSEGEIRVADVAVDLSAVAVWEPRPNWPALNARRALVAARLPELCAIGLKYGPVSSLLALLDRARTDNSSPGVILTAARRAADALRAGWAGELAQLREGAAQLAGLGWGLTPSGDDFLIGAMLWAYLAHPAPDSFCRILVEAAAPLTTTLSAAFLRAAARGECMATWHALLDALSHSENRDIDMVAQDVLARGATSGADTLAGFLWMGLYAPS